MKRILIFLLTLILVQGAFAGGIIIVSPVGTDFTATQRFNPFTLEVKSLKVETYIQAGVVRTQIEQIFYNPSSINLQGFFLFPVPKGSVLREFTMDINGKQTQAELLDANQARAIYEDIVRKTLDPALLEYAECDLFKIRIFPIEALKEKKISITYSQILNYDNGMIEYTFPLNTKKYSAKPIPNFSMLIKIEGRKSIKTIYSPTHELDIKRIDDNHALASLEMKETKADMDLSLLIGESEQYIGASVLTHKLTGDDGFFLMAISPGFAKKEKSTTPKDVTFVLDVSGSMADKSMDQAKKALNFCISNLNANDNFQLIKFSTLAEKLFEKRMPVNAANTKTAQDFVANLKAIGGTNMEDALKLALSEAPTTGRSHVIIFITDGKPTIGETKETELLKKIQAINNSNVRIFTFGIGYDINTKLLDEMTELTSAYRSYITPEEDIELKISAFFEKVNSPVLTNIELTFGTATNAHEIFPNKLPDLFRGSELIITGRYRNPIKDKITVSGLVDGKKESYTFDIEFGDKAGDEFVSILWASNYIGYLLDQIRLKGENRELIETITTLAKKYGIITPYTSYLILEDERISINNNHIPHNRAIFNQTLQYDEIETEIKDSYDDLKKSEGSGGVRSSIEVQNLKNAVKVADVKQGGTRMNYQDKNGESRNVLNGISNKQGRAIYQTENEWVDIYLQDTDSQKPIRIKFADKEYFALINKNPEVSQFLCLGKNVSFKYQNQVYEVYE